MSAFLHGVSPATLAVDHLLCPLALLFHFLFVLFQVPVALDDIHHFGLYLSLFGQQGLGESMGEDRFHAVKIVVLVLPPKKSHPVVPNAAIDLKMPLIAAVRIQKVHSALYVGGLALQM